MTCQLCRRRADSESLCHGCRALICKACDLNPLLRRGHLPDEHRGVPRASA